MMLDARIATFGTPMVTLPEFGGCKYHFFSVYEITLGQHGGCVQLKLNC